MKTKLGFGFVALSLLTTIWFQVINGAEASEPDPAACTDRRPISEARYDPCRRPVTIIAAKVAAAHIYDRYLKGEASFFEVDAADRRVEQFTRVDLDTPVRNMIAAGNGTDPNTTYEPGVKLDGFEVFQQTNEFYCGPATAQSILRYFAKRDIKFKTAAMFNPDTGEHDVVYGHPRDQHILANISWLATNKYGQTNWGERYMPESLNDWRGDLYYTLHATAKLGGTLDKDTFMKAVRYNADRGFPIAVNARYNADSYYPAGFHPGIDFMHWDVAYGYFEKDGVTFVQQGQVFAAIGYGWVPYQNVPLDTLWSAIGQWHGIVW
jgi:hypothetical protein